MQEDKRQLTLAKLRV